MLKTGATATTDGRVNVLIGTQDFYLTPEEAKELFLDLAEAIRDSKRFQ